MMDYMQDCMTNENIYCRGFATTDIKTYQSCDP